MDQNVTTALRVASQASQVAGSASSETETVDDQNELEAKRKRMNWISVATLAVITTSFGFQGIAVYKFVYSEYRIVVIAQGVVSFIVSAFAAWKQFLMMKMETMRCVHNRIRMDVNRFTTENTKLTANVNDLETEAVLLECLENQLRRIAQEQGTTATELAALVKENGATIKEQSELAKAAFQEELLATVLRADRDGDFQFDAKEADMLMMRMRNHGGIDFDEDKVREVLIKSDGSLVPVLQIIQEIGAQFDKEEEEEDGAERKSLFSVEKDTFLNASLNLSKSQAGGMSRVGWRT